MIIRRKITHCDYTNRKYEQPVDGGACIAQGATGRWCEVLWIGPEHLAEAEVEPISREEAITQIEKLGGWADF